MESLRRTFLKAINLVGQQSAYAPPSLLNDFNNLPELLQKFIHLCGYTGFEKIECAHIKWNDTMLKLSPKAKWSPMRCYQVKFLSQPVRLVYMKISIFGLLPLEALDLYKDAHGSMSIKLMKIIPISNATGKEIDASELVTILAETIFIPHYALQKYITWEVIDASSIKGTINYNGISVSGIFHFNQNGECTRFVTQDRYFTKKNNKYQKTFWTATANDYKLKDGIRFPTQFNATWHTDNGDYEYFKGSIKSIEFNKTELSCI
ncbi:hypothetical protein AQ505_12685 [Pedobacter sp. PACM 27299]|uniref:DUF6920 family protein n=1 Tax=Pedobacter sp. PACM 27299 TaxID=1727164 RepID=UPI000706708F|nr:DUF6544 family protein [Pedobacter sp. PACM 27299]ALL06275.1 hypothetical protein AQ505_12685 [Pedobacter sp. PACM 27299]